MSKILVANWKEHPSTEAEALVLARESDFQNVVMCPSKKFLGAVCGVLQHALLGAQDYEPGLPALGVRYVIIGHSSRRRMGDTNSIIAEKLQSALRDRLVPLLCVENAEQVIEVLSEIRHPISDIWIAYEPVWAISTEPDARAETPEHAARMICAIKEHLIHYINNSKFKIQNSKLLYGGSITSANAQSFLQQKDIDGLLVGAASIDTKEIKKLCGLLQQTEKNQSLD